MIRSTPQAIEQYDVIRDMVDGNVVADVTSHLYFPLFEEVTGFGDQGYRLRSERPARPLIDLIIPGRTSQAADRNVVIAGE